MGDLNLAIWGVAYGVVGFGFALAAASRLYREAKGDVIMYACGTVLALLVWVAWPVLLALAILIGAAFLLFSGSLLLIQLGWQQARGWWHRQPRLGRKSGFTYREVPPPREVAVSELLERPRRD